MDYEDILEVRASRLSDWLSSGDDAGRVKTNLIPMSLTWITDETVIGCPEEEETEVRGRVGPFDEEKKKKTLKNQNDKTTATTKPEILTHTC